MKEGFFADLERSLRGQARLEGVPTEIIEAIIARMHRIYARCVEKGFSFSFNPMLLTLTAEQTAALTNEVERILKELRDQCIAHCVTAATMELAQAEAELYNARRGENA